MKGLELSEQYYCAYGADMIEKEFPDIAQLVAVGLTGSGSECFGYDDGISSDHDFEPGFCIFIPDEDVIDRRRAFELERAYARLPREFMGYSKSEPSPVGGSRHGVIRIGDFLEEKIGRRDHLLSAREWLSIPENSLAEATNGKIFYDGCGYFTDIRRSLSRMPEDVMLKKLAGELWVMGQSGEYNYERSVARGETGAAQLAAIEFAKAAMHAAFLLCGRYMPYYKWSFRAMRELEDSPVACDAVEYLISSGNGALETRKKLDTLNAVSESVRSRLLEMGFCERSTRELHSLAYSVNGAIKDASLRNMHILCGV